MTFNCSFSRQIHHRCLYYNTISAGN